MAGNSLGHSTSRLAEIYKKFANAQKAAKAKVSFGFQVVLHTPNHDLSSKDRILLRELIINRNYVSSIGDYMEVQIAIPLGTFLYRVYDNMDNMEVTLRVRKQFQSGSPSKPVIVTTRYKAVYLVDRNNQIPNNRVMTENDLNDRLPVVITLQLIDRTVEALRVKTIPGGSFGNVRIPVDKFMASVISREASNVLIDGLPCLDMITTQPATVQSPMGYLTLPSFSKLIEMPDYLQEKSVGVYSSGLGCYIQKAGLSYSSYKRGLWTYSLYDPDRTTDNAVKCIIYCSDEGYTAGSYPGAIFDNTLLTVLGQGASGVDDDKEAAMMSEGTGFRVGNAAKLLTSEAFKVTKKGPVFERAKMTTEVLHKKRRDGVNFAPQVGNYSNHLALGSAVLARQAVFMTLSVMNIDHDLILPGKLTKIIVHGTKANTDSSGRVAAVKASITRLGILHEMLVRYSGINNNPIMDLKSTYSELTSVAELKYCVGKPT